MELVPSLLDWQPDGIASAVTIGMFDGVHLGHQSLLRSMQQEARIRHLRTVAITFDRSPRILSHPGVQEACLTDLSEKTEILRSSGVDLCAVIPVDSGIISLRAEEFVRQYLVERLQTRLIVVGYDFRFGHERSGNFNLLQVLGQKFGYTVNQADPLLIEGQPVKSTRIRNLIRTGKVEGARRLLGRPFSVSGDVAHGDQVGRELGFPTANVAYHPEKLLPSSGVYGGWCLVNNKNWLAVVNLGFRPTITTGGPRLLEAHLPGFGGDLYGQQVTIQFMERIREERRFGNLSDLREQIGRDVEQVRLQSSAW